MSQPAPPRVVPMSRKDGPRAPGFTANRRLDTDEVLAVLLHEGVLTEVHTKRVRNSQRGAGRSEVHPLVMIANAKLEHAQAPGTAVNLEYLTE